MDNKKYIIVKDGKMSISDIVAECDSGYCFPVKKGENLKSIINKICEKIKNVSFDYSVLSNYLENSYTSHSHSNYINTSVSTVFLTSQYPIAVSGSNGSSTFSTIPFGNMNGLSFYLSNGSIVGSYTTPVGGGGTITDYISINQSSLFQLTSQMSDYINTSYTSHNHSQYFLSSQTSEFQQTSLMSNYLGSTYTSHSHSQYLTTGMATSERGNYINTSQSNIFQQSSNMSNYIQTEYTTHLHSQYLTTAMQSNAGSNFIATSQMSDYLQTNYTTHTHSNIGITDYISIGQSSLFEQTSQMTDYLGTNYTTHTHSYTVPADYLSSSQSTLFQQTSQMSDYLLTSYTSHTHSQYLTTAMQSNEGSKFVATSQSSVFQQSSQMTDYLQTGYTTHSHSQYLTTAMQSNQGSNFVNTSQSSLFELSSHTSVFQQTSLMTNYLGTNATQSFRFTSADSQLLSVSQSSLFQLTANNSLSLGTDYTSHTHSQYLTTAMASNEGSNFINTSQSSLFQNTSLMSNYQQTSLMTDYLGTSYSNHTHSQYLNTSQSSLFEHTSHTSVFLTSQSNQAFSASGGSSTFQTLSFGNSNGINFSNSNGSLIAIHSLQYSSNTSAITSNALNTSQSSLFQQTSLMTDYLGSAYSTHTHSQYLNTSVTSNLQQTSAMSLYQLTANNSLSLDTNYTSHTHSQYLNTSQSSLFEQTSIMSNYLGTAATQSFRHTSADSQLQFTSAMSNYLGTAATQSFRFTSANSQLQFTSQMSDYLGTAYTTHTHSQYVNTSVSSNFLTSQTVQPVAASGSNGSFIFSTLSFGNLNGLSFYTSNGSIVGSYTDGGGAGGGIALANSQTTFNANTVNLSAAGAMTIQSTTGQSFVLSTPATSMLSATGQLSISTNGSTISIGVPNEIPRSFYNPYGDLVMVAGQVGQGTLNINPNVMPAITFDRIYMPINNTNSSNSSGSHTLSFWVGIYTQSSNSISLLTSASQTYNLIHSGTAGSYSLYSGMRHVSISLNTSLSSGRYYIGVLSRTTSGGTNGSYSQFLASNLNSNFLGHFGSSHNTTMQFQPGNGVYSATLSSIPSLIAFSQIRGSDSLALRPPVLIFANSTL